MVEQQNNSGVSRADALAAAAAQGEVVKKLKSADPKDAEAISAAVAEL